MNSYIADLITLAGLLLTLVGAGVTAKAVILREDDAIKIGLSRYSGGTKEGNLKLPMVQNLLWSSKAAKWGLVTVGVGTLLQAVPVLFRVVF
ncbi:hypothetical protein GGQ68_002542 [Sagittula marina]|uniref:Uncharacterized protein n=1 Tax=Sagittula marina TaxID=943940 RepID=A0A7W6DVT4_9RHOB|nr:hypothetical protein [Sagittula marina]